MKWRAESIDFSSSDGTLHGELIIPERGETFAGAVLCHGMGTDHRAMRPSAQILARRGIATLTFDFRGHGQSDGIVDENVSRDAIAAVKYLASHPKIDPQRIALVGHSFGAMAAILGASKLNDLRALVCISSPGRQEGQLKGNMATTLEKLTNMGSAIKEYPRGGSLPVVEGIWGILSRLWMWLRGYRFRINWQLLLNLGGKLKAIRVEGLGTFPKLFVHCKGDKAAPYEEMLGLYQRVEPPKELLVANWGFHALPLFPGRLRGGWISWLVSKLGGRPIGMEE